MTLHFGNRATRVQSTRPAMIYNRFLSVDRWYAFVVILRCVFRTVAFSSHLRIFHRPSSYFFSSYLSKYIYKHTYTYGSSLASFRSHKMSDDPVIDVKARNARARLMATMSRVLNVIFNAEFLSDTQKKAAENIVNRKHKTRCEFQTVVFCFLFFVRQTCGGVFFFS